MKDFAPIKFHDLSLWLGPMVYMLKKDDEYLYIGATEVGLRRIFGPAHAAVMESLDLGADLFVIPCQDWREALKLEHRLIREHKPSLNKVGVVAMVLDRISPNILCPHCQHGWPRRVLSPIKCPKCKKQLNLKEKDK